MHSKSLSIGAAVALAAAASTAFAGTPATKGVIELTRFDLTTSAGQAQLDREIRRTALGVCSIDATIDMPQAKHLERLCYEESVANARAQIAAAQTAARTDTARTLATLEPGAKRD